MNDESIEDELIRTDRRNNKIKIIESFKQE